MHGSTVAINTVVERKGARTALVVTEGTRDVYAIGRGNRPDAYDVWFKRPEPLVPRHLTFEVDERLGADGARAHAVRRGAGAGGGRARRGERRRKRWPSACSIPGTTRRTSSAWARCCERPRPAPT